MHFINLQRKTLAEQQLFRIVYRLDEASTMRSETRAPRLVQFKSEDKLIWVELCNLGGGYLVKNPFASQSLPRRGFQSITGIESVTAAVITLVYRLKSDEIGSVRHTITWIAVPHLANADVITYCYFNGQWSSIFQETSPDQFILLIIKNDLSWLLSQKDREIGSHSCLFRTSVF